MEGDPIAGVRGRAVSLRQTKRVEGRRLAACAVVSGAQLVDDRGAARGVGEIRVCQGERRSWASEDRRRAGAGAGAGAARAGSAAAGAGAGAGAGSSAGAAGVTARFPADAVGVEVIGERPRGA